MWFVDASAQQCILIVYLVRIGLRSALSLIITYGTNSLTCLLKHRILLSDNQVIQAAKW